MRKVTLVILLRVVLLAAVAASAALFVEYQNAGDPAFCGVGSGCLAVRLSPYSRLFGVPLPNFGLAAYSGLFLLYLIAKTREARLFGALLTGLGGVAACSLLVVQKVEIHAFCKWCVIVDASAIVAAGLAALLALLPEREDEREFGAFVRQPVIASTWALAFAIAIGAPFVWGTYPVIPPLVPEIAALQVPGKITIVSFTDFECPFCRALHPVLHEIVEAHPDRIVLVRRMMPLSGHFGAMPAALAYTCTLKEHPDKLPAMIDALYAAPEALLMGEGPIALAAGNGMDRAAFTRCVDAPETRADVEKDMKLFSDVQGQALPLTYVGPRVILGLNPDRLRSAVDLALKGDQPSLPVSFMFALLAVAFAAAVGVSLRLAPAIEDREHSR